jgi:hypothetical protein
MVILSHVDRRRTFCVGVILRRLLSVVLAIVGDDPNKPDSFRGVQRKVAFLSLGRGNKQVRPPGVSTASNRSQHKPVSSRLHWQLLVVCLRKLEWARSVNERDRLALSNFGFVETLFVERVAEEYDGPP